MKCKIPVGPYTEAFNMIAIAFNEVNVAVVNLAKRSLSASEYEAFCKEIDETHNRLTEKQFKHES